MSAALTLAQTTQAYSSFDNNFGTYTTYTYDPHGSVRLLTQRVAGLDGTKQIHYRYDLLSGKVNFVHFQPENPAERFVHQYRYDADNRIVSVRTSCDGYIWQQEAVYRYLPHGPLLRTELGEYKVQTMENRYTLNGWLKGVNAFDRNLPSGSMVSRAVLAYELNYYLNDYKGIGQVNGSGFAPALRPSQFAAGEMTMAQNRLYASTQPSSFFRGRFYQVAAAFHCPPDRFGIEAFYLHTTAGMKFYAKYAGLPLAA